MPGSRRRPSCLDIQADDIDGIVAAAQANAIDFVVVGPEGPLCAGLVDRLEAAGIAAFGPSRPTPPSSKAPRSS